MAQSAPVLLLGPCWDHSSGKDNAGTDGGSAKVIHSVLFCGTTYFALTHIFGSANPSSPAKERSGKMSRWFGREKYAEMI